MGRACNTNGGKEEHIQVIGVKARRKEITRKTKMLWVDNIKMDLGEMG
jgi:hypothetical protein